MSFSVPASGMNAASSQHFRGANGLANPDHTGDNLVGDTVDLMNGQNAFNAGAGVIKSQDEMLGTLLDTMA